MQIPAEPDLRRYYDNHKILANRLSWLWHKFREYEGTGTRHLTDLESLVLQVRLSCEQYALLLQSACFQTLPGTERSKSKQFDAIRILAEIESRLPHVSIVPLSEIRIESGVPTLVMCGNWKVNDDLFKKVYERGGNFLHVTNRALDARALENYINNSISLIAQLIFVTWRHVVLLDGLAGQIVSQILPGDMHSGFVLKAVGRNVSELRSVRLGS